MPVKKVTISLTEELATALERRGGERSTNINRALERYFSIMAGCRRDLRDLLNDKEIALILDSFNGVAFWDPVSVRLAWANVADAISMDGLDQKWQVDGPALVEKLKGLDPAHATALVEGAEGWWNRAGNGEQPPYKEALA